MLVDGRLARIDIGDGSIRTRSGAAIGTPRAEVEAMYAGRFVVEPHAYMGPADVYLTVYSDDHRRGLRFEIVDGRVGQFYVGTGEAVQYIEGCS
jgi:hypothetical protein